MSSIFDCTSASFVTLMLWPQSAVKNAVSASVNGVRAIARAITLSDAAAIANRIQRCLPTLRTPYGATIAPTTKPTAAVTIMKVTPANPASVSSGSLNLFRSSTNVMRVSAVRPPL